MTDDVTPAALEAAHGDPGRNYQRYLEAVEAGWFDRVPPEEAARLVFFLDGHTTPELVPMWFAFTIYAAAPESELSPREAQAAASDELVRFGLGRPAADFIVRTASRQRAAAARLRAELAPEIEGFLGIVERAERSLGRRAHEAAELGEVERLAGAAAADPAEVERLRRAWLRDPGRETVVESLTTLAGELSVEEWNRFRSFLLATVAPTTSTVGFGGNVRTAAR